MIIIPNLLPILYIHESLSQLSHVNVNKTYFRSGLQGKDLAIVVNNVAEFQHEEFAKVSYETLFRATNVNCHAQGVICNTFLTKLMSRNTKSAIIK